MVEFTFVLMFAGPVALTLSHLIDNYRFSALFVNVGVAGLVALTYFWTLLPVSMQHHDECVWCGMIAAVMYITYALWRINEFVGDFLYSGDD